MRRPGANKPKVAKPEAAALQEITGLIARRAFKEAGERLDKLKRRFPRHAAVENLQGVLHREQGQNREAAKAFGRAASLAPSNPHYAYNKGSTELLIGDAPRAQASLEAALRAQPDFAQGHALLGEIHGRLERFDDAQASFHKALELEPGLAQARHGLGLLRLRSGDAAGAAALFAALLESLPERDARARAATHANLGLAYDALGRRAEALSHLLTAERASPRDRALRAALVAQLRGLKQVPETDALYDALLRLIAHPEVNPRPLATAAQVCLRARHDLDPALAALSTDPEGPEPDEATFAPLLGDPLFLALLDNAPVTDVGFELLLTRLRRAVLEAMAADAAHWAATRELLAALVAQTELNERVFFVSEAEETQLDALLQTLRGAPLAETDWPKLLAVCLYRPLSQIDVDLSRAGPAPAALRRAWREQILDPLQEAEIAASIPALGENGDAVSAAVRRQYAENPYPRWSRFTLSPPGPLQAALARDLPDVPREEFPRIERPRILIAGCGTGLQTMRVVCSYAGASVLAIDFSAPSLAYGARKLRAYGVDTVEHRRADILSLGALEERFDLIESYGVIHHMADPAAALAILTRRLKPGGLIYLGLYSALARESVVAGRRLIAERGFSADLQGVRAARRAIIETSDQTLAPLLSPASDFWTTSDARDLILHAEEHRFTLPEIDVMLAGVGLEFLGVVAPNPADRLRFLEENPEPGAARSLQRWSAYETAHPETFGDTYKIWARLPA